MKIMSKNLHICRYAISIVAIILVALSAPALIILDRAAADETTERAIGILVEDATIRQIGLGNSAILKLKITNLTPDSLTLRSIKSPIANKLSIVINFPNDKLEIIEVLPILEEETLNISSSHLWIRMDGLSRTPEKGERIPFTLVFSDSSVSAVADVHGP